MDRHEGWRTPSAGSLPSARAWTSRPVRAESALADDLGVDSLGMIEIGVSLEERFGLRMPDAATPDELGIVTVGDLVGLAMERLQEAAR